MEHERSGRAPVSDRSSLSLRVAHSQIHDCATARLRWTEDGTGRGALLLCLIFCADPARHFDSLSPIRQHAQPNGREPCKSPSVRGNCDDAFGWMRGAAFAKSDAESRNITRRSHSWKTRQMRGGPRFYAPC